VYILDNIFHYAAEMTQDCIMDVLRVFCFNFLLCTSPFLSSSSNIIVFIYRLVKIFYIDSKSIILAQYYSAE